jgi:hypothetical protein
MWTAVDPAGQYFSGYTYSGNNPSNIFDPNGAWGIHIHGAGSFIGALQAGESVWSAAKIGYNAIKIDLDHPEGGKNQVAYAERHAIQTNGEGIGREAALARTDAYVQRQITDPSEGSRSKRLGYAGHASSDKFAHEGIELQEHGLKYWLKDVFGLQGVGDAARETKNVVQQSNNLQVDGVTGADKKK